MPFVFHADPDQDAADGVGLVNHDHGAVRMHYWLFDCVRFLSVVGLFFLCLMACLSHPAQVHVKILVVVCEYADTETPELNSQQWADELNLAINSIYTTATHQQAPEFEYIPIPGVSKLDFPYASREASDVELSSFIDDPALIDREGIVALKYARQQAPEFFSEPVYLLAIVNRPKEARARSLFDFPLITAAQDPLKISASISVIADPLADRRFTFPDTTPESGDEDGDGLSDDFEARHGTRPDQADSDGDGFTDWAELALGISDPLDPVSKLSLPDRSISSVAHLIGHQIGLPGLHPDGRYIVDHSMGYWGLMSLDNSQGLSGFTRFHTKWMDRTSGELVMDIGSGGLDEPLFYLVEPSFQFLGRFLPPGVFELVRIRRPSLPDILLEARPKFSVDASRIAEGFSRLGNFSGLPTNYQPGVLVSQIDLGYDGQPFPRPGQFRKPVVRVLPHEEAEAPGIEQGSTTTSLATLELAAIQEQQTFLDAYGLEIHVGSFDRFEGSYEVTLKSGPVPTFSDLVITDSWMDSSANGFGYFSFGMDEASGTPKMGGDPVHLVQLPVMKWVGSKPEVELLSTPSEHQVVFQIHNVGSEEVVGVTGIIYVLPAYTLPIGDSMFDAEVLTSLSQINQKVFIEKLEPDQSAEVAMTCFPEGPIQAFLILDQASNELATHNNQHRSVFWTEYATLDTFYPSIKKTIRVYNGASIDHHLVAQISGVPEGWEDTLSGIESDEVKWTTDLQPGSSDTFQIQLKPPMPRNVTPGISERFNFETWVDYADTDVPAGDVPITVVLALPSKLSLDVVHGEKETFVSGVLANASKAFHGLSEAVVSIAVAGSDGSRQFLLATTSEEGEFSFKLEAASLTRYAAIVHFHGNASYAGSQSDLIEWGESGEPPLPPVRLAINHGSGHDQLQLGVSNALPQSLMMELQVSNDLVHWRALDQKEIPPGNSVWPIPLEITNRATFFHLVEVNGELFE